MSNKSRKVFGVSLKRMVDGTPQQWFAAVLAASGPAAAIAASRQARSEHGISDCTWTVTRSRAIGNPAANFEPFIIALTPANFHGGADPAILACGVLA